MKKTGTDGLFISTTIPMVPCFGKGILKSKGSVVSKVLLALLGLALSREVSGEPVGANQARNAVIGWLNADPSPLQTPMAKRVKQVESYADTNGTALYYVVDLDPEGFVIVSADNLIEPVIAFAPAGQFDPSSDNPLGALVSHDLPDRIAKVKSIEAGKIQGSFLNAKGKWARLEKIEQGSSGVELGIGSVSDVRVAPLTQTLWDQLNVNGNACYNYYTPPNAEGSTANYYCGCVATAMAQLMRFWQYPVNGVGTASFTISVNDSPQSRNLRGGNGAGGPYVWANMVLNPAAGSTVAQRQAIGALCADAGVSVNMDYTSGGSGADTLQAKTALVSTFGYANAVKGYNGNATIGAGLNGMINPNLDAGCPVLLGITGLPGGHAIVCDGYGYNLSTLYHHLNLGWSGYDTAWYALPTIDTSSGTFSSVYKCVYNVWTNGSGEIVSGRVSDSSGNPITNVVLTAMRSGGGTYTVTNNGRGIYAFAKIPASSAYIISASKASYAFTDQVANTGSSTDNSATSGNQWAVDFVQSDSNNPTSFSATAAGGSLINLSWAKNSSGDNVMVAWNSSPTFGIPTGSYSAGSTIVGGGTVLYNGGATTASHTDLTPGTTYYYKAWSVRSGPSYSSGATCSATTICGVPFTEGFEHGGAIPDGWTQEYVTGTASWAFQNGGGSGVPPSAHGGSYNAVLYYEVDSEHKTKLVTPRIDFGTATDAQLTFWHFMEEWSPDQDELRVYFKDSPGAAWTLLATYTTNLMSWTQRTISLPNPSSSYYVAFEGNAMYGFGVCIDDVAITAQTPMPIFYSFTLDTDPGWTRQGQWAYGHPTGQGGATYGSPDPANGATGANVFGVNLSGDYSTTIGGPYYLAAGPLNFSGCTNVILQFQRWLNTDYQPFAYATLDVSSDGINWIPYFSNGTSSITDAAWTRCQYDISPTARNQPSVYVRWGYQVAGGAYPYSGWNIDDIRFSGLPQRMPHMGAAMSGTNLVINCAYGTPSGNCYLLMSTNIALPRADWTVVASNIFDGTGCCVITNRVGSSFPQQYFLLRSQ